MARYGLLVGWMLAAAGLGAVAALQSDSLAGFDPFDRPKRYNSGTGPWALADPSLEAARATENQAYYPDCHAARAAGAAPIGIGEPGYRPALDRDGDGVACEPYPRRRW